MTLTKTFYKPIIIFAQLLLITFVLNSAIRAAGEVDPTFNPGAMEILNASVSRFFVQADGKILIAGNFGAVGKIGTNGVARLNADGTIDPTFHAPPAAYGINTPSIVTLAAQSDGKVIIGGSFSSVVGQNRTSIARLNADGSLDTTFNPILGNGSTTFISVSDIKITTDDKIIVVGNFSYNSGANKYIVRLNSDGTIDSTFNLPPAVTSTLNNGLRAEVQADGKIFFAGTSVSNVFLYRLNGDGSLDSSFNINTFRNNNGGIYAIKSLADGKVLVGGGFDQVNGFTINNLVRFNADGTIDPSFAGNNATSSTVRRIEVLPNNQILIGGGFSTYNGISRKSLAKINADGTLDNSIVFSGTLSALDFVLLQNGKILLGGQVNASSEFSALLKLNADGSVDSAPQMLVGNPGIVYKVYVQPDGKILIGGSFTHVDNQLHRYLVRYNADGTLDSTFNPPNLGQVNNVDVRADGKILVATGGSVVRLNANGTSDVTMGGSFQSLDAKFLPGGGAVFTASTVRLRRATESGVFDSTLDVLANNAIRRVLIQPDGKMIVAGDFTTIGGATRGRIARVNTDGSIDQTFNTSVGTNSSIFDAVLQSDGKIVIGGNFTGVNFNTNYKYLARLNSDGTLDTTFNPAIDGGGVQSLRMQSNGKILVGGSFYLVSGALRVRIARVNSDGTLDASFDPGAGADDAVLTIDVQANGRIVIGGLFKHVNNFDRLGVARLIDAATTRMPYDFDGDGRSDISVFRPSNGTWYLQQSQAGFAGIAFGAADDLIAPADYDGDGKTDVAVFRPSNGTWYLQRSTAGFTGIGFGASGDVPVPADYDGDGKADLAVFRPSNGVWYIQGSQIGFTGVSFGANGDVPVAADYDGDGKADVAVFRPSNGVWYLQRSQLGFTGISFGDSADKPVPADYDGDGKADITVFRPSNGTWYLQQSTAGFTGIVFGANGDLPVPADYDGDGKTDVSVFRPSNGVWYLQRSTQGFTGVGFGVSEDKPIPNAYVR